MDFRIIHRTNDWKKVLLTSKQLHFSFTSTQALSFSLQLHVATVSMLLESITFASLLFLYFALQISSNCILRFFAFATTSTDCTGVI